MNVQLFEETRLIAQSDECIAASVNPPYADDSADWGSDPMEILMAKQERERAELEYEMCNSVH